MKKTLALVAVSALGLTTTVTACSAGGVDDVNADGAVVVQFWHAQSGDAGKLLEKQVETFNESHRGDIEINAIYQGSYADNFAKLAANIQTGYVPGLMQASDVQSAYMKDSGLALPLQDALGSDADRVKEELMPAVRNYYIMDGVLWSMPMFVSQPAAYINTEILDEAGIDPASLGTFDDYFDAAEEIFRKTGIPGLVFAMDSWWNEEFTAALNLEYCTPGNGVEGEPAKNIGFYDDRVYELWERVQRGIDEGYIVNAGSSGGAGAKLLTAGKVAIQFNSSGNVSAVQEAGLPFMIRPLPRDSEDAGAVPGGNSLWIMEEGKTDEQIAAAAEFARFVASDEFQTENLPGSGYLPATKSAFEKNLKDPELPEQQHALLENLGGTPATTVTAGCHIGSMSQIRTEVANAMQAIARGQDPEEAFADIKPAIDGAIDRYEQRAAVTRN